MYQLNINRNTRLCICWKYGSSIPFHTTQLNNLHAIPITREYLFSQGTVWICWHNFELSPCGGFFTSSSLQEGSETVLSISTMHATSNRSGGAVGSVLGLQYKGPGFVSRRNFTLNIQMERRRVYLFYFTDKWVSGLYIMTVDPLSTPNLFYSLVLENQYPVPILFQPGKSNSVVIPSISGLYSHRTIL